MELELLHLLQGNYSTLFFPLQWIQLVILHIHPAMTDLSTFRRAVALTRPFSGPVGYFQKRMFQKSSQHG